MFLGESTSGGSETDVEEGVAGSKGGEEVKRVVPSELKDIVDEDTEVVVQILNSYDWVGDVVLKVATLEVGRFHINGDGVDFIGVGKALFENDGDVTFKDGGRIVFG